MIHHFGNLSGSSSKDYNIELLYNPATPLLHIQPKEMKIYVHTKTASKNQDGMTNMKNVGTQGEKWRRNKIKRRKK